MYNSYSGLALYVNAFPDSLIHREDFPARYKQILVFTCSMSYSLLKILLRILSKSKCVFPYQRNLTFVHGARSVTMKLKLAMPIHTADGKLNQNIEQSNMA